MRQLSKRATVLGLTCGLSACASIVGGTHQHLSVETRSASHEIVNAECTVSNSRGEQSVSTPGVVTVHRDSGPVDIRCVKDGAPIGSQQFSAHVRPMVWGNLLFGGLIGVIVDFSDGAARHYPNVLEVMTTYSGPSAFASNAQSGPINDAGPRSSGHAPAEANGLASMDGRISPAMFNAAQNVAATRQCARDIHVVMADGKRALFVSRCAASAPLQIECNESACEPLQPAS